MILLVSETQPSIYLVNILTTDPKQGWKRFVLGLAAFVTGLILMLLTPLHEKEIHYFAIAIIGSGFAYAMTGYIPMLLHRLTSAKRQSEKFKSNPFD